MVLFQRILPGERPAHGADYPSDGGVLEDVPGGTRLKGVVQFLGLLEGGEDEHEGLGQLLLYGSGGSDTIHDRHPEVHQDQLWPQAATEL